MGDQGTFVPFSITMPGTQDAVRSGLAQTMARLVPLGLAADETNTVELVLAEALNNIVEHALESVDAETVIRINGNHSDAGLDFTIVDHGSPMPDGAVPTARVPQVQVDVQNLPEGGFGWFMIHTLARNVEYVRVGSANRLSLRICVGL